MITLRRSLTEYLCRCNVLEMLGERLRMTIAQNPYFQIQTIFQRFDKFKKGYLIPQDLAEFMLENKIYPTEAQLYLIFRDFDQERSGVITITRFQHQLLPRENNQLKEKALIKKYYQGGPRLEIDLEFLIARFFEHKIKESKQLGILRVTMIDQHIFSAEDAFTILDFNKTYAITKASQIDQFLRSNGKVLKQEELERIFRVINFNKEGALTFETFAEHFDPLRKGYYINYSQRIIEKQNLHDCYLSKKMHLQAETMRNSQQKIHFIQDIQELRESNRRLGHIMLEQDVDQSLLQQREVNRRIRRNLF